MNENRAKPRSSLYSRSQAQLSRFVLCGSLATLSLLACSQTPTRVADSDASENAKWRNSHVATLTTSADREMYQNTQLGISDKNYAQNSPLHDDGTRLRDPAGALRCNLIFATDMSRLKPNGRLVMDIQDLQDRMNEKGVEKLVKHLTSSFVRMKMLHLQALSKVYLRRDLKKRDSRGVEDFRQQIKSVEKIIGDYMRVRELKDLVETVPFVKPEVLARLELRKKTSKLLVEQELLRLGWAPDPVGKLETLMGEVTEFDLGTGKQDQELTVKGLRDLVQEEREMLKDLGKFFKPARFTQDDLENGLHTMRRALRWVGMVFPATEGMFTAKDEAGMQSAYMEAYGESKYLQSNAPAGVAQVQVGRETLLKIVMLIEKLGELKDFKESELDYAEFLFHEGLAVSMEEAMGMSHQLMVQAFKGDIDVETEARKLYEYYLNEDPLKDLRNQLDRQLKQY